jgi:hypothetical protein
MTYPTLEQYNEAFQHANLALTDPEIKQGTVRTTGLGLPLALCGGFALTYTISAGPKKFAVRCFHKQSSALEQRYSAISSSLKKLKSPHFVDFEFQPRGVSVLGKQYPVVKMAWATGSTLGEFLEKNYKSQSNVQQTLESMTRLARFLESNNLAHGDIQPGNVMIASGGAQIQLIDYDGIYVDELRHLGSAELGHRNFQHPMRNSTNWDSTLDRFSFICINFALRVLQQHPEFWIKTQSDGDSILFKANDFADPTGSAIFSDLFASPKFSNEAKNFAAICKSAFREVPTLEDFLAGRNIPKLSTPVIGSTAQVRAKYLSAFPVVDATNYDLCLEHVGEKLELIGKIVEVKTDKTRHGKPYVFINFGPWQGKIVKISIWSEGIAALSSVPNETWVGRWVSVVGLMEPPYVSRQYKYSHLTISITQGSQLHIIAPEEAKFRLNGAVGKAMGAISNREVLQGIRGVSVASKASVAASSPPLTSNQALLKGMKGASQPGPGPAQGNRPGPAAKPSSSNCFVATAIYGRDAHETNMLRRWRDDRLLTSKGGHALVRLYYSLSPFLVPYLHRYKPLRRTVQLMLNWFIESVVIDSLGRSTVERVSISHKAVDE